MARKSTMVTSIDEIVGWNKMADGRILSNEEFDGENGHPVYLCPETESFFRLLLNHCLFMERRIHSGIYRRAVPEPEAETSPEKQGQIRKV